MFSVPDLWDRILAAVFGPTHATDERLVFVIGSWAILVAFFWVPAIVFETARSRGWWSRYRINATREPSPALVRKAIVATAIGHVLFPVGMYILHPLYYACGVRVSGEDMPSPLTAVWHILVQLIVVETGFYWAVPSASPYATALYFHSGAGVPIGNYYKAYGMSVRCIHD